MYDGCKNNKIQHCRYVRLVIGLIFSACLTGCGGGADVPKNQVEVTSTGAAFTNEIKVLEPAKGDSVTGNEIMSIDYSNASEGYIIVNYTGDSEKTKFQMCGADGVTYTYNLKTNEETVLPLSADNGEYSLTLFESIGNNQYSTGFADTISVEMTDGLGTFLYPNQYVDFNKDTKAVALSAELTAGATSELDAVGRVYGYVIEHVVYDKIEAETVKSGYLPVVDEVLDTGKGICLDYAALMASMLRSQGIPTRLEIGYAKDAYHAWISVYTKDQGWIGGVIQFDGTNWTLMDPTLGANSKNVAAMKDFIGDGTTYNMQYKY